MKGAEVGDRIRNVRITPVRLREGYDMGEVDRLLDQLERAARQGESLADLVQAASFTKVRWREGYDIDEVDRLLAELARTTIDPVEPADTTPVGPAPSEAAWAIRGLVERVRFTPVRLVEGYDMADVDALLDEVVAAADRGEPVASVIDSARPGMVRLREGYSIPEVDRFLRQLKGEVVPEPASDAVIKEQRGLLERLIHRD